MVWKGGEIPIILYGICPIKMYAYELVPCISVLRQFSEKPPNRINFKKSARNPACQYRWRIFKKGKRLAAPAAIGTELLKDVRFFYRNPPMRTCRNVQRCPVSWRGKTLEPDHDRESMENTARREPLLSVRKIPGRGHGKHHQARPFLSSPKILITGGALKIQSDTHGNRRVPLACLNIQKNSHFILEKIN